MAIKIRCPKCYLFNSVKNNSCTKCGQTFKNNKSFYIEYIINKKVKREYGGTNITQARNLEIKKKYEIRAGITEDKSNIDFKEYVEKIFITHYQSKNKAYSHEVSKFNAIIKFFDGMKLKEISSEDIDRYHQYRLKINKPATAKNHLAIIKRIFNYSIEMGYLKNSPVKTRPMKFDNKRTRFLNYDEKIRLLDSCCISKNKYLYAIVQIALQAGLRKGEIKSLKSSDIANGMIQIKAENTKATKMRVIPLTEELARIFNDLGVFDFDIDFDNAFEWAVKRAKIEDFHFHDLRHTFASDLVMKGVDLYTISKLLGHSTIEMTQRYAHLAPSALIEAIKKLN